MINLQFSLWFEYFIHGCILLVFIMGMLCFFLRKQYIRQLVGLKLMLQSVSLGLIFTGWQRQDLNLAQSMVISALVIEAVVIGLALTMIIHLAKHAQDRKPQVGKVSGSSEKIDD